MDTLIKVLIGAVVGVVGVIGAQVLIAPTVSPTLGSLAGPDIASPYLNWGGARIYHGGMALTQGASTTCSIQSPSSTSTLLAAGIKFDVATSSGTMFIEIGKASDAYSTTTLIGTKYALTNSAQDFISASTSPAAGKPEVFGPNTYFNVKIGGTQAITSATQPVGRCQAEFMEFPTL